MNPSTGALRCKPGASQRWARRVLSFPALLSGVLQPCVTAASFSARERSLAGRETEHPMRTDWKSDWALSGSRAQARGRARGALNSQALGAKGESSAFRPRPSSKFVPGAGAGVRNLTHPAQALVSVGAPRLHRGRRAWPGAFGPNFAWKDGLYDETRQARASAMLYPRSGSSSPPVDANRNVYGATWCARAATRRVKCRAVSRRNEFGRHTLLGPAQQPDLGLWTHLSLHEIEPRSERMVKAG